jgi:hypothetical protein
MRLIGSNVMSFSKIKGTLTSRIGRPVRYGAPADVSRRGGAAGEGVIIDEVWADPSLNSKRPHREPCKWGKECWGDYSFCAQLIEWNDGSPHQIRLAYYRRRCGEDAWEYASQMTVSGEWKIIQRLLTRTLAKTTWFKDPPSASHLSHDPKASNDASVTAHLSTR